VEACTHALDVGANHRTKTVFDDFPNHFYSGAMANSSCWETRRSISE